MFVRRRRAADFFAVAEPRLDTEPSEVHYGAAPHPPMSRRRFNPWFQIVLLWLATLAGTGSLAVSLQTGKFWPANRHIDQRRYIRSEDPQHYWQLVGLVGFLTLTMGTAAAYSTWSAVARPGPGSPNR